MISKPKILSIEDVAQLKLILEGELFCLIKQDVIQYLDSTLEVKDECLQLVKYIYLDNTFAEKIYSVFKVKN